MSRQRIKAGLKRAVAQGVKLGPTEDRHRDRTEGAKAACEGRWYLEGGQVARARDGHGAAHLKGASNEPARGAAMTSGPSSPTVCYCALPPGRGTFHFEILVMPPLTKTCPKWFCPIKGVAFV